MSNVTAEVHGQNLKRFADELVSKHKDRLEKAFPGRLGPEIAPMQPKPPRERLAFYTMITDPQDFPLLMDEFYLRKRRQGWLPNPVSPYWLNLLALPWGFELYVRDFRSLYRRMVENVSADAEV